LAPTAVHVDGTARPQVVEERDDPWLFEVLSHFRRISGCPMLINTSFNRHREPIVRSGSEALESSQAIGLGGVVIGGEIRVFEHASTDRRAQGAGR